MSRRAQRELADELLAATGQIAWVEDEALLDPVTAISGGGPAYVFLLTELMEQAGLDQGLPPDSGPPAGPPDDDRLRRLAGGVRRGGGAIAHRCDLAQGHHRAGACECCAPMTPGRKSFREAIAAATERSRELSG